MIDLHTHVLPGIDDGPRSLAGSIELVAAAEAAGTTVLAATPHVRPDHPRVVPRELAGRVAEVQDALAEAGVAVEVVTGGEIDLAHALGASDAELQLASLGGTGTELLVESPYGEVPAMLDEMLLGLAARGYRILLAHPERNPTFRRRPERLASLVRHGILLQVTAGALAGPPSRSRRFALGLVREDLVHVIASDAHGAAGPRPPGLAEGVAAAVREVGPRAEWLVRANPEAILAREPLPAGPAPAPAPAGGWWRRLRGS